MAIPGPVPKDPAKRQRQNRPAEFTELPADGYTGDAPDLPGRGQLLKRTRDWYATWASSPQATQFSATDWQRLAMLALIVDAFYREPSKDLAAEIRLQESKLGATAEDRQKLRWRIVEDDQGADDRPRRPGRRSDPRAHLRAVE